MIPKYLIVILNEWTDPKECGDPQVFDDPKEIAIGSMDFNDPKIYGESPSVIPPSSMVIVLCVIWYGDLWQNKKVSDLDYWQITDFSLIQGYLTTSSYKKNSFWPTVPVGDIYLSIFLSRAWQLKTSFFRSARASCTTSGGPVRTKWKSGHIWVSFCRAGKIAV